MFGIFALIAATGFTTTNIHGVTARHQRRPASPRSTISMAAILLFGGHGRQVRPVPAARVAARRHGRPHARLGADPRRHDGGGRRLPDRAPVRGLRRRQPRGCSRPSASSPPSRCWARRCWPSCRTTSSACSRTPRSRSSSYMIGGPLAGQSRASPPGFFHLFTHAFFKALLFLCAGSVIHAVHSNNMSDMGGLRKKMPITFWTMLIGSLALAGIFPFAGFWSKDELLVVALGDAPLLALRGVPHHGAHHGLLHGAHGDADVQRRVPGHGAPARVAAVDDRAAVVLAGATRLRGLAGLAAVRFGLRQVGLLRRASRPRKFVPWIAAGRHLAAGGLHRAGLLDVQALPGARSDAGHGSARCGTCSSTGTTSTRSTCGPSCSRRATRCRRASTGSIRTCWTRVVNGAAGLARALSKASRCGSTAPSSTVSSTASAT